MSAVGCTYILMYSCLMTFHFVLPQPADDGTEWLEIEKGTTSGGWYLYSCHSKLCYDMWFETMEDAFLIAEEEYRVGRSDWHEGPYRKGG